MKEQTEKYLQIQFETANGCWLAWRVDSLSNRFAVTSRQKALSELRQVRDLQPKHHFRLARVTVEEVNE